MLRGLITILVVHFYHLGYKNSCWGTKNAMGYKIYRSGTFSKLLPRIVSIITTKPNSKREASASLLLFIHRMVGLERSAPVHTLVQKVSGGQSVATAQWTETLISRVPFGLLICKGEASASFIFLLRKGQEQFNAVLQPFGGDCESIK